MHSKQFQIVIMLYLLLTFCIPSSLGIYKKSTVTNSSLTAAKWDVRFDTASFNETSTITSSSHNVGDRNITYAVTLPKPGSTYSFTVNVKNYGTIDASLKKITMTGLTEAQANYITHTVTYAGTTYTETTDDITGKIIAGGGTNTATVVVTVSYDLAAANQLPQTDQEVTLNVQFDYVDANL